MQETVTTQHTTRDNIAAEQDKPYLIIHKLLDFMLFLIQGVLLLDFILLFSGANRATGFFQLIHGLATVLMAPFRYILPVSNTGDVVIDWSILVAMVVYAIFFLVIRKGIEVIYTADRA